MALSCYTLHRYYIVYYKHRGLPVHRQRSRHLLGSRALGRRRRRERYRPGSRTCREFPAVPRGVVDRWLPVRWTPGTAHVRLVLLHGRARLGHAHVVTAGKTRGMCMWYVVDDMRYEKGVVEKEGGGGGSGGRE